MMQRDSMYNHLFSALSAIDQKKARRRNIVPARIGYFALLFMCCYGPIYCGLYMIQIQLGSNTIKFEIYVWNLRIPELPDQLHHGQPVLHPLPRHHHPQQCLHQRSRQALAQVAVAAFKRSFFRQCLSVLHEFCLFSTIY